ncbi:MAG: hypothetical protein COZ18_10830 [Flexibacter sp. CG_4_10_14_3_um_filter_32_15]|nr:MAG: hypothetical protein COZ18_10830 [Flexibacter sp. CG_4_10_14_3_um_filter_32_15]
MKYRLVKISNLSGNKASVYSVLLNGEQETIFDKFVKENIMTFEEEVKNIIARLKTIGKSTGIRDSFVKPNEGTLGDGVCALYDNPDKKLRLYCIKYGTQLILVGGGGQKNVRTLQEDDKLKKENYFLRKLSAQITERIKDKEIEYINNYLDFEGDLEFQDDDEND